MVFSLICVCWLDIWCHVAGLYISMSHSEQVKTQLQNVENLFKVGLPTNNNKALLARKKDLVRIYHESIFWWIFKTNVWMKNGMEPAKERRTIQGVRKKKPHPLIHFLVTELIYAITKYSLFELNMQIQINYGTCTVYCCGKHHPLTDQRKKIKELSRIK